jgi:tetratricopeptide (TPR) repeat protein
MRRERRDLNDRLKEVEKELETTSRQAIHDKEYLEQKAKNATADKMMFEAKVEDLESRAFTAEARLAELEKELSTQEAKATLQESEIMVLRDEKSKLEQKLIRYIERIIQEEDKGKKDAGAAQQLGSWSPAAIKKKTKREIAQQKLDMHYNMALAYDRQGLYREEEREYLKCLRINPNDANVHYNLAILYDDKLNENKKAIKHYNKFLQLRPVGQDAQQVKTWMIHAEQEDRLGPEMR